MSGYRQRIGKNQCKTTDNVLFKAIWKRAQREIADAEKVSFIGLSSHEFLESVPAVSAKLKAPNTKDEKFEDVVKSAQDAAVLVLVY